MINYIKNKLLFELEKNGISLEILDEKIGRPKGYCAYCICNRDVERLTEKDMEKLRALSKTESKHSLSREMRENKLSSDYILHVLDIAHEKIMQSDDNVSRHEGMLTVWACSSDFPGNVRDAEVQNNIGYGEEYLPIEGRKETFFAYGPTYSYTYNGLKVFFCKAIRSWYDEELDELEVYPLCDMVLTDSANHLIDYLELEYNPMDFFNWKGDAFSKIEDIYDALFEMNKEVAFSDKWEIREEP